MNLRRAYDCLLQLYPRDYRALFFAEMLMVFEEAAEERRGHGWAAFVRFAIVEFTGFVIGAGVEWLGKCAYVIYRSANLVRLASLSAEWVAKLTYAACHSNSSFRSRCVPDRRMMRPAGVSWELWYGARTHQSEDRA